MELYIASGLIVVVTETFHGNITLEQ